MTLSGRPALKVEAAFGSDPLSGTYSWTDISAYVLDCSVRRGNGREIAGPKSGSASLRLNNRDRRFDPGYSSGAYYPNVKPRVPVRISAVYSATTYQVFFGFAAGWPQSYANRNLGYVDLDLVDGLAILNESIIPDDWVGIIQKPQLPTYWWRLDDGVGGGFAGAYGLTTTALMGSQGSVTPQDDAVVPYGPQYAPTFASDGNPGLLYVATADENTSSALGDGWTLSLWFKTSTVGSSSAYRTVYATGAAGSASSLAINAAGRLVWTGSAITQTFGPNVCDGEPHHVALSGGNNTVSFYLDGVLCEVGVSGSERGMRSGQTVVGCAGALDTTQAGLIGQVSDLAYWNTSAVDFIDFYVAGMTGGEWLSTEDKFTKVILATDWNSGYFEITSDTHYQVSPHQRRSNQAALSQLSEIVETEEGLLYCDRTGSVVFRPGFWWDQDTDASTSQITFTDSESGSALGYSEFAGDYGTDLDYVGEFVITWTAEAQQIAQVRVKDATAITSYGPRTKKVITQHPTIVDMQQAAVRRISRSTPKLRYVTVVLKPARKPSTWATIFGLELGSRVTMTRTPQGIGSAMTGDYLISAMAWQLTPNGEWTLTLSGEVVDSASYFTLDTSALDGSDILG